MTNHTILNVHNLNTWFFTSRGVVKAVNGVSFDVRKAECLCLVGESGCGKSVTALSLLRLIDSPPGRIVSGEARYGSTDLLSCSQEQLQRIRGKEIALVFQDAQSALNPIFTIGNQITEQLQLHLKISKRDAADQTLELLKDVGLADTRRIWESFPHQLSGGMKQRAMIAMSLSCDPQLLIADEPTTAVDVTIKAQIVDLFRTLKRKTGKSFLFITHDFSIVSEIGDRAVVMYAGKICETGTVSQILESPKHPYTVGLMNCLPDIEGDRRRLFSIPGTTPDPINLPTGCFFHPRCPRAFSICSDKQPVETQLWQDRTVYCHLYGEP